MKHLAALCTLFALTGCVGVVKTYSGERNIEQIAIIKGGDLEFAGNRYLTFLASYAPIVEGNKPESHSVGNSFTGYPREIHIEPGKYLVMTKCHIANQYAFPAVAIEAEAGMTYEIKCEPIPDQLSRVRAKVTGSQKSRSQTQ
jgi:hypothetical protein